MATVDELQAKIARFDGGISESTSKLAEYKAEEAALRSKGYAKGTAEQKLELYHVVEDVKLMEKTLATITARRAELQTQLEQAQQAAPEKAKQETQQNINKAADEKARQPDDKGNEITGSYTSPNVYTINNSSGSTVEPTNSLKVDSSGYGQIEEKGPKGNFKRRTWNPLSSLSSYTYHLRLYMMTPEDYNEFSITGKSNPSKYYVIAESGGSGSTVNRLKELKYDYYIDDVIFKTFCNTRGNDGPIIDTINFEFKIYEPYGFSFTSRLQAAATAVLKSSPAASKQNINPLRQFFMLGITFYGYDSEGNPVNDSSKSGKYDEISVRYFAVTITDFRFKIDGKLTTYSVKAAPINVVESFGVKRGQIPRGPLTVSGSTVREAVYELMDQLNTDSEKNANKADAAVQPSTKYKIEFATDAEKLMDSKLYWGSIANNVLRNDQRPSASNVKTTKDSTQQNAQSVAFNKTEKNISISAGITIVQAIEKIINNSEFINSKLESYKESTSQEKESKVPTEPFQYFTIKPIYEVVKYNDTINDYIAKITYKVFLYDTPFMRSAYVNETSPYPDPHKIYNYFFTGQNSEVISYEQAFNNLYFVGTINSFSDKPSDPSVPIALGHKQGEDVGGKRNMGGEGIASAKTSLYSIADQARAKIQILGDPDYIMTLQLNESKAGKTFYEDDGFTISPRGGQVFIRINFNEPDDYNNETGLQVINDKIQFYNTPSKTDGILYMVNAVTSSFSKGKFSQELDLFIAPAKPTKIQKDTGREAPVTGAQMYAIPFEKVSYDKANVLRSEPLTINSTISSVNTGNLTTDQTMAFNTTPPQVQSSGSFPGIVAQSTVLQAPISNSNPDDDNAWNKVVTISDYGAGREPQTTPLPGNGFTI